MRIIKTQQSVNMLRSARTLSAALLDQIEDYFAWDMFNKLPNLGV
ncbi:hypothetical protein MKZ07_23085 [Paenibacillus sp. FSL P4-0338]|nr:hypothetical protein [Paenibacillus sp. FSL R7-269]